MIIRTGRSGQLLACAWVLVMMVLAIPAASRLRRFNIPDFLPTHFGFPAPKAGGGLG
jgi:hypothetical protein